MGTKTVRLDEAVYEHIKSKKRDDETFSEAIDRLTSDYTLLDFAGGWDEDDLAKVQALQEKAEQQNRADREELLDRMGVDVE
jgi:predicted CopG family antitoxin